VTPASPWRSARAAATGLATALALMLLAPGAMRAASPAEPTSGAGGGGSPSPTGPPPCAEPLQGLVDAAAPGSTLRLPACTSTESLVIGQSVSIDAHGTVIDGRGRLEHAVIVEADDVAIDGLTVTGVANPVQDGAVRAWDVDRFAFRDGHIRDAAGACISVARGEGSAVTGSTLEDCGQEGLHATLADRLSVVGNRIAGNNPAKAFDPGWEAGGAKVTQSVGVVFEDNEVAANYGPGIWCDINCRDVTIRGNRVHDNARAGIHVEISDGALVTDNVVWENGWAMPTWGWGAGILISTSRNVDVEDNVLAWNADGIVVVSQDRDDSPGPATGLRTERNVVASETGREVFGEAWLVDGSAALTDPASGNGGIADRFWFTSPEGGSDRFAWGRGSSRLDEFRATPGGVDDTYLTDAEVADILAAADLPGHPGIHPAVFDPRDLVVPAGVAALVLIAAIAAPIVIVRRRRRPPSTRELA
jgi:parallel beta-helix repeat protein